MRKNLVLVAEDEDDIRTLLADTLADAGFDVIQAQDGSIALEKIRYEHPDIVLLDVWMPVMGGFEVLKKLRDDPETKDLPVVILTALNALEGEKSSMDLGVTHYMTKPLDFGVLEATLRVVVRESQRENDVEETSTNADEATVQSANSKLFNSSGKIASLRTGRKDAEEGSKEKVLAIRTADKLAALEQKLGGGMPFNTVTLVEGAASSGKSILCQHFIYGALEGGVDTTYFTSEHSEKSLITQMSSLGLDVSAHLRSGRLQVYGVPEPKEGESPEPLLASLAQAMEALPVRQKFIVVDSITDLAGSSSESAVIAFFTSCRRMSNKGRTVLVSIHSYAFGAEMFNRLRSLCDGYLSLRSETVAAKAVKTLEVRKMKANDLTTNNTVSVEIVPLTGMKLLPISRTKA
ncbi:MAG: response regulator [SAR202 cluster bacterium]|nr:response regulator [SAR202 cluster bacterium]